jgi:hypothetical protein
VAWWFLKRFSTDWSSSKFSRRSTDQTCQSLVFETIHRASGTKYAAPAEVPGSKTRTFFALLGPTLMTPTRLYLAGVAGAAKPRIQVTRNGGVDAWAGEPATASGPTLDRTTVRQPTASAAETTPLDFRIEFTVPNVDRPNAKDRHPSDPRRPDSVRAALPATIEGRQPAASTA